MTCESIIHHMKLAESQLLYIPDETYYFGVNKELSAASVPDEVAELLERENAAYEADKAGYFEELATAVCAPVTPGGPKYAVIREQGSSEHTAMVFTLPFCNPLTPDFTSGGAAAYALKTGNKKGFDSNTTNNLIKHGFTFDVMKALGVRDSEGKTIPIVIVSADSADYNPYSNHNLNRKQKKALKKEILAYMPTTPKQYLSTKVLGACMWAVTLRAQVSGMRCSPARLTLM